MAACTAWAQQSTPAPPQPLLPADEELILPADWGPSFIDAILNSPNQEAGESLFRAAFAAGTAIVPHLEVALKDDRTAEFAAQSLAFIGGEKAIRILWNLLSDPRDLNLRRFYYGALGEFDDPNATRMLLSVISRADAEPDRTVTQAAIHALTVRSDGSVLPQLRGLHAQIQDLVLRDDLESAIAIIELRSKLMSAPGEKRGDTTPEAAVRTYFAPALEFPPPPSLPSAKPADPPSRAASPLPSPPPPEPAVKVHIEKLTFSPNKKRVLARVIFEDSSALARYDMVLRKRLENWVVASVWLDAQEEKAPPPPPSKKPS